MTLAVLLFAASNLYGSPQQKPRLDGESTGKAVTTELEGGIPIYKSASKKESISILHNGERLEVIGEQPGHSYEWRRIRISGTQVGWVMLGATDGGATEVSLESKINPSRVYVVSRPGSEVAVYAAKSLGESNPNLSAFLIFGANDSNRTLPKPLLPGAVPLTFESQGIGGAVVITANRSLSIRIPVRRSSTAARLFSLPDEATLSDKKSFALSLNLHESVASDKFELQGAEPMHATWVSNHEISLNMDFREWKGEGSPSLVKGSLFLLNAEGMADEVPISIRVLAQTESHLFESDWLVWPGVVLSLALVFMGISLVLRSRKKPHADRQPMTQASPSVGIRHQREDSEGSFHEVRSRAYDPEGIMQSLASLGLRLSNLSKRMEWLRTPELGVGASSDNLWSLLQQQSRTLQDVKKWIDSERRRRDEDIESRATEQKQSDVEKASLEKDLSVLRIENAELRTWFMFVEEEGARKASQISNDLFTIEDNAQRMQQAVAEFLSESGWGNTEWLEFRTGILHSEFLPWITNCRRDLETLANERRSTAREFVHGREGQIATAEDLEADVRARFFHNAVSKRWDRTLRLIQRFYSLGFCMEMTSEVSARHRAACDVVRSFEEKIRNAFIGLDVLPVELSFLKPVPANLRNFTEFSRRVPFGTLYPLWKDHPRADAEIVLDVDSWAYLSSAGKDLWGGEKARIVGAVR